MMRSRALLVLLATLILAVAPADVPAQEAAAIATIPPLQLTLKEAIVSAFKNNLDVKVASYVPFFRSSDVIVAEAAFDPNVTLSATYRDASNPTNNIFDIGSITVDPNAPFSIISRRLSEAFQNPVSIDTTQSTLDTFYDDRLRYGAIWSADLFLSRSTSSSANSFFPESYFSALTLSYTHPFLKNFGRKANEALIIIANNDRETGRQQFRGSVLDTLLEVENAYWTLVFARQDLDVRNEALKLAQELLKLNQIKVQVGTLPPIDITQAEAGVASREEDVIIADAAIQSAQDRLRRVMGMDPNSPEWRLPIVPTEDLSIVDRPVDLQDAIKTAIDNRPDLAEARLTMRSADADLAFRRNQLKYSLDGRADYILQGLAGDTNPFPVTNPTDPNLLLGVVPPVNAGIQDTLDFLVNRDFPTYELRLTLGIPIGNRAAKAQYSRSRLTREQASISYATTEQAAIVQVSQAVRRVVTDRKRIDAAEKNRVLQERKVEAEQKKFENGLSTSFQVLTFQSDLAEARSRENQARTDYRISMAALDQITGVLDRTLDIRLDDYPAH